MMCRRNVLTIVAVAILALAIGQSQAITVDVPNGDFQTIYKPDTGGTVTATVPDGCYWSIPGMNIKGGGPATYSDGTTGDSVETPGWVTAAGSNTNADCMQGGDWGGPLGSGDVAFLCFASWGGPTYIESAAPLSVPAPGAGGVYELSADVGHAGRPLVLELLVDGVAQTPDTESSPPGVGGEWVVFTRTYSSVPAGDLKILVGTRDDAGTGWTGNRASVDNITLTFESDDPTLPDVDAGPDMITWSGQKVELDPNVVNNGATPLTYLWTANPAAGVVFDPSADVEDPNVTITKPATVTTAVTITNPGFETPVLADGGYSIDFTDCPGWSDVDVNTAGGVWNPGLSSGGVDGYGGNAPEGQNIAYVNSSGIKQVLTKTFAVDTTYTLTVKVGNTEGFDWTGYKVQLLAGETVLAEDDNSKTPATDTFETSTVTYTYDSGDAALVGQALQIRLFCLGSGGEADFDNVQLTAEAPTPVPYVVTLTLAVNNEGSATQVKDTMKVYVYDDACQAARMGKDLGTDNPGDFNGNCITDANDLAELAAKWLTGDALTTPIPKP